MGAFIEGKGWSMIGGITQFALPGLRFSPLPRLTLYLVHMWTKKLYLGNHVGAASGQFHFGFTSQISSAHPPKATEE